MLELIEFERQLTGNVDERLRSLLVAAELEQITPVSQRLVKTKQFIHHYREPRIIHFDYMQAKDLNLDENTSHVETTAVMCYLIYHSLTALKWIGEEARSETIEALRDHFVLENEDEDLTLLSEVILGSEQIHSLTEAVNRLVYARKLGMLYYDDPASFSREAASLPDGHLKYALIASIAHSLKTFADNALITTYDIPPVYFALASAEANDVEAMSRSIDTLSQNELLSVYYHGVTSGSTLIVEYLQRYDRFNVTDEISENAVLLSILHDEKKMYELLSEGRENLRDLATAAKLSAYKIISLLWQDVINKEEIAKTLLKISDNDPILASFLRLN